MLPATLKGSLTEYLRRVRDVFALGGEVADEPLVEGTGGFR
jgi:hypothetical protein